MVFEDEASLANAPSISYSWSERGKQPRIRQQQRKRERRTLFGCVEPATGKVFTHIAERGNTLSFLAFLVKVCKAYPGRKVIMVLDNVAYHHAKRLKPLLEYHKKRLQLEFLPPYSPDLNPIERVWWWMRKHIAHNRAVETMQQRIDAFNKLFEPLKNGSEDMKTLCNLSVNIY